MSAYTPTMTSDKSAAAPAANIAFPRTPSPESHRSRPTMATATADGAIMATRSVATMIRAAVLPLQSPDHIPPTGMGPISVHGLQVVPLRFLPGVERHHPA